MQIAIVTGASSGIGREFARELDGLQCADEIWLVARSLKKLDAVSEELNTKCVLFPLDLTHTESFEQLESALSEQIPVVKYLINAAGYGRFGDAEEVPDEDAEGMIELNNRALVMMTNLALPYMISGSHIINMGSISAYMPLPDFAVYAASKAFVLSYSYARRAELIRKDKGITVTAVCPSWVDTAFFDRAHNPDATLIPKSFKPISSPQHVVKKALSAAAKNKPVSINRFSAKVTHVLSKILPRRVLIALWRGKQKKQYGGK